MVGELLNAGANSRLDGCRLNLSQQTHKKRYRPRIDVLDRFNDLAPRASSAEASLNHWNFSTTRSHDIGLSMPPS